MNLDPSQRRVVDIAPSTRQIVTAGPGSGKTEVVSALVARLIDEGCDPALGVLVVSFSNAAIHAVDARLRANGTVPVAVQTLDSIASDILRDLGDGERELMSFDERVRAATAVLAHAGWERLAFLEHLIIDEVQDIVGVRADFVRALIESLQGECGFTVLGDPAQAIYDFQLKPAHGEGTISRTTSRELIDSLFASYKARGMQLTEQYRAQTRETKHAISLRDAALHGSAAVQLDRFWDELALGGNVRDVAALAAPWAGLTVFLTATNGQALLVARELIEHGYTVGVRRAADERVLAPWIAILLADCVTHDVTKAEVSRLVAERVEHLDADEVWRALRSVVGGRGANIDLRGLSRRLRSAHLAAPILFAAHSTDFVVSTVHRAKGLEFDNVVLVEFPGKPWLEDERADDGAEAKERFVAITRARQRLVRASGPDDRRLRRSPEHSGERPRWFMCGNKRWQTFGFEIRPGDVADSAPAGEDPAALHDYLASMVKPGDPLEMSLDQMNSTLLTPVYRLLHDGNEIAKTSARFGQALVRRIGVGDKRRLPWPRLRGATVDVIATVTGERQSGPAGRLGLWLAPVVTGMLQIDWNEDPR